jgi:alanine dehydrogenase
MVIGVLKEPPFETRVSLLPDATATLTKKGITVLIEDGAGEKAFSNNDDYTKSGAQVKTSSEILQSADVILEYILLLMCLPVKYWSVFTSHYMMLPSWQNGRRRD